MLWDKELGKNSYLRSVETMCNEIFIMRWTKFLAMVCFFLFPLKIQVYWSFILKRFLKTSHKWNTTSYFFFFFASGMESQFGTMSHTFHLRLQKPINKCLPVIITVPLWPKLILFWTFISVFLSSLKKK